MMFRRTDARTTGLPYSTPISLPRRSLDARSTLGPRWTAIVRRGTEGSSLSPGYIALIVILVIVLLINVALVGFFLWRRHTRRSASRSHFSTTYPQEKRQRRSWQRYGSEWFGGNHTSEETRGLVAGRSSRMPSITISRPISNATVSGPTPVFNTRQRDTLHSVGIMELPDSSQSSPEAIYDPYDRSRSRSRSNSLAESLQSATPSRSTSPNTHVSRSRNSSFSSNHSRSPSSTRSRQPLAQNSYINGRNRSPSNGPSRRATYQPPKVLTETVEEYDYTVPKLPAISTSSPTLSIKSSLSKSLPPPPALTSPNPHKNSLSYTPSDPRNWQSDPYSEFCAHKPQFDFADYDVLHETTQVIDIAIAEPLDIPQGPLTPFGEREAKAGAALGLKSDWYKSPGDVERGTWLV